MDERVDPQDVAAPEPDQPPVSVAAAPAVEEVPSTGDGLLLNAKGITKRFGGLVAVRTIDFDIPRGAIVSLIGPNGAGKTTFFNVIAGLSEPTEGWITFDGEQVVARPRRTWAEPFFWFALPVVFLFIAVGVIVAKIEVGAELLTLLAVGLLIGSLVVAIIRPPWYVHMLQRAGIFRSARPNEMVRFGIGRTFQNIRLFAQHVRPRERARRACTAEWPRRRSTPRSACPGTTARKPEARGRPANGSPTWA